MVKPGSPDYYQILGGISPTATQEEIKKMYKQMSLVFEIKQKKKY